MKLLFPSPFPCCTVWKEVAAYGPHSRNWGVTVPLYEDTNLRKLFKILTYGRFVSSLLYLLIQLFIAVWIQECLFYTFCYNLILLYFVAQIVLALAIRSSGWLLLTCPINVGLFVVILFGFVFFSLLQS